MMHWTAGQTLNSVEKPPITKEQLAAYADASGDHNPIHLNDQFAREAGFPSVIVHGMLSMAFIADALQNNFPDSAYRVLRFKTRFRKVTFPGDAITCGGVVKKRLDDGTVVVSLWAKDQAGELKSDGEAELLPV